MNGTHRKTGVDILIFDKIDFKIKEVTRDKDGHFIVIKETLHQEDKMLLCISVCVCIYIYIYIYIYMVYASKRYLLLLLSMKLIMVL